MVKAAAPPDDERALLLLGLLHAQDRHGYELHDFIENNFHRIIELKKATAYQLLDRLEQHQLVHSRLEQHGQRPSRKVYSLTPAGRSAFQHLLTRSLAQDDPLYAPGNIALMFMDHLPPLALLIALRARLKELNDRLARQQHPPDHPHNAGVTLAHARAAVLTRADRDWLAKAIIQLEAAHPPP
ncbi:helix-turn-helix transcriptional regulator [Deinococcus detaillensis]|uniref:Helix-turn-helix transcriptional regulator n=1 Tax=Deinococcus detaillensis TaxID=2592048 RepID=A0A553UZ23_9DEIO|nr:PadR family transcriptional regulator [Deinococcus detaillensis]TSA85465.1 helix-turn-helix transcriptional regulator [Deinococcus detaillensis]